MKKIATILAVLFLGSFLVAGSAMAMTILDFADGDAGGTGSVRVAYSDIAKTNATAVIGANIGIDRLLAQGVDINVGNWDIEGPIAISGETAGSLSFNTNLNNIQIFGSVPDLNITSQALLTGSFDGWTWTSTVSGAGIFEGWGSDQKAADLLRAFGIPLEAEFNFYTFVAAGFGTPNLDISLSFDYIPSSVDIPNYQVPEPASMLLLGAGLFGLAIVGRKRFTK